jgi:hypothetical protein
LQILDLVELGWLENEALDYHNGKIAFPRIMQHFWPHRRRDKRPGHWYHFTQLPTEVETDPQTGFALVYNILFHFKKPNNNYTSSEIINLTTSILRATEIELGDIVEPIAPLCGAKGNKTWNGMIRIHLKYRSKDSIELLEGKCIFALVIDETLTIAKVCKGYDNLALQEQLATKITSNNLIGVAAHMIMQQMIADNYRRRYEFEVTQVIKNKLEDSHVWIITTSPKQRNKTMKHKVAINGDLICPTTNNLEKLTEAKLAKKNCLMLIAVNLNMYKTTEEVEHGIKEILGDKNVVNLYFPRRCDNAHSGTLNVECQFPTTYKQYVKQTVKLHNKYIKFTPHPRSMDRANVPSEETLWKFGFLDVNTALANTVQAIQNAQGPIASNNSKKDVSREELTAIVKEEIKEEQQQLKIVLTREMRTM